MLEEIRASEIGNFVYCHRAYWLAEQGEKPRESQALRDGRASHQHLATGAAQVQRDERRGSSGYAVALVLVALAAALWLLL